MPLMALQDDIVPDIVAGWVAAPYISVGMVNTDPVNDVTVTSVALQSPFFAIDSYPWLAQRFKPGQTVPVILQLTQTAAVPTSTPAVNLMLTFSLASSSSSARTTDTTLSYNLTLQHVSSFGGAYKFTFLDSDGSVQYASLLPPSLQLPCPCSILLTTHGAGVDAASTAWTGAYPAQRGSWILFPTNRRPYGFDWHNAGLANVWAAFNYFTTRLPGVPVGQQAQYQVDASRVLYGGHRYNDSTS